MSNVTARMQFGGMPVGLDRARPEAKLQRSQGEARRYLQGLQSLPATAARGRSDGGHPLCRAEQDQEAMARAADGTANDQGGGGCARQLDARMVWALMTDGERYREPFIV
jgi:hypothetical protein